MPSLAQYLFHLAADQNAYNQHHESREAAVQQMTTFGLDEKQQTILLTADQKEVEKAVNDEIPTQKGEKPFALTIQPLFICPPPKH